MEIIINGHINHSKNFAAQFIYLDLKGQTSKNPIDKFTYESIEKYINILDLYADIDPKTFRNIIIYDLLKEFIKHFNRFRLNQLISQ